MPRTRESSNLRVVRSYISKKGKALSPFLPEWLWHYWMNVTAFDTFVIRFECQFSILSGIYFKQLRFENLVMNQTVFHSWYFVIACLLVAQWYCNEKLIFVTLGRNRVKSMEICKKGLVKSTLTDAVRPRINPFHTDISMHILHTVLFTFPKLLQVEFVWQSRVSLIGVHFLCISDLNMWFRGDMVRRI